MAGEADRGKIPEGERGALVDFMGRLYFSALSTVKTKKKCITIDYR